MRDKISKEIYDNLSTDKHTRKYPAWEPKSKGFIEGVVLVGGKTFPKKIYVKNIPSFDEAFDHFILTVAKKCGVRAPKVKIKTSQSKSYLFSTGIDTQKKSNKQYHHQDLSDFSSCSIDTNDLKILHIPNLQRFFVNNPVSLDKITTARLFLICLIFGLKDLNPNNIGIVVSNKTEIEHKKAKISLLDFELFDSFKLQEFSELREAGHIKELVMNYIGYSSEMSWMDPRLIRIAGQLNNSDFIEAFTKIEMNFERTFNQSSAHIPPVLNQIGESTMVPAIELILTTWMNNFNFIKKHLNLSVHCLTKSGPGTVFDAV